ncbi:HAD family hydrolase [Mesorhizobium sp. CO1-1-7]|uniref:phosphoglycolate phosphatase n=1 Tax=Mesorhizobium australicum (strain HAMBI 3006 / LMG 24608 / WSM2073) TaxID=754035 RepID=L0KDK3_MESAW|nr:MULTISPECIES: HAD family hydrolase [Mesorhizobium]MBZ9929492.1 HAD family hydrolase [Mesorhizobium sp. BR1-1-5]AGB42625.1 haloacid dehalogenase superfamily enzyme, subfamily IA [Mesorhizobium australicum WSM2073]MBZ9680862.1 HAD family hydrolase [Mesorhizobium sp. CO1-1-2]MBZ9697671.1 HAD family hydrolase [Mesorhizobium sp. CO1-1-9]MBZ9724185.1 HAD family hydrolase [Mesorhizobium sp. CO1-1-11]
MADIKGILFDKDGTLVDFNATWLGVADFMAMDAADGDRWKADRLLAAAGFDFANRRFKPDSIFASGTNLDVVELWFPRLSNEDQMLAVARFNEITSVQGSTMAVALPGIADTLALLHRRSYRLGVATNDSTSGAEKTLVTLGVAQLFEAAYGYDAVANPKPAPDTIQAFCDLTGLKPSEIAMVGDNRHDLEMARAGGCGLAVGVLSGTGTRESLAEIADVILDSVADLPDFLSTRVKETV